jgi:hypothetical protein
MTEVMGFKPQDFRHGLGENNELPHSEPRLPHTHYIMSIGSMSTIH